MRLATSMTTSNFEMSRSRRKVPIFGFTSCRSEKQDKKTWHGRMRARERDALASLVDGDEHLTTVKEQVSSTWEMGKDGRYYWPIKSQEEVAEWMAERKGKSPEERASIKASLLRKWAGK